MTKSKKSHSKKRVKKRSKPTSFEKPSKKKPRRKPSAFEKPSKKPKSKPLKRKPKPKFAPPLKSPPKSKKPKKAPPSHPVDVAISELEQEQAFATIEQRLKLVESIGRIRIVPYADGSIDGEVLAQVPHGTSTSHLLIDIENALGTSGLKGFWISVGVRFTIKEDDEVYRRFRGYNDVNTHFQKMIRPNVIDVFDIARHQITEGMEDKYGRKADSVYVRIHWNPANAKPEGREPH